MPLNNVFGQGSTMPPIFGSIKSWTQDPNAGDIFWQNSGNDPQLQGVNTQGWYPIWKQPQDITQDALNKFDPNTTSGGFSGVDYTYFTDMLKKMMATGDPNQALYRQGAQANVNTTFNKQGQTLKENLAGSGMLRSGVGQNALASLDAGRSGAMGQVDTALAAQDTSFRQNALSNLLGLQGLGLQEKGQNMGLYEFLKNLQNNQYQFDWQKNYQEENTPSPWGQILGQLIGGGAQVGSAAILASDERLKENIKKVGETREGIPIVNFNYKGNPITFKGVLAQQVEKKHPEAVYKMVDYSKIPDATFEVVN